MKINFTRTKESRSGESIQIYLNVLAHDASFERAVWQARGRLGIPLDWLRGEKPNGVNKATYDESLSEHPNWHPPQTEFDEDNPVESGRVILEQQTRHDEMLVNSSNTILNDYNLPRSWVFSLGRLIHSNEFPILDQEEPVSLHIETEYMGKIAENLQIPRENWPELALHNRHIDGLKITLSAKITPNALNNWLKEHWNEIERLSDKLNLPDYHNPEISYYRKYRLAYELRQQRGANGKLKPFKEVAEKMTENLGFQVGYFDAKEAHKRYLEYFINGTYSKRITRAKS